MSATFEILINGIRTTTVGEMTNVVKQVEWTLKGTEEGQTFELPQKTIIADPSPEAFIALSSITPANVTAWVESNTPQMDDIKAHIQMVLTREVAAAALTTTAMPWAPAPEPEVAIDPAPAV